MYCLAWSHLLFGSLLLVRVPVHVYFQWCHRNCEPTKTYKAYIRFQSGLVRSSAILPNSHSRINNFSNLDKNHIFTVKILRWDQTRLGKNGVGSQSKTSDRECVRTMKSHPNINSTTICVQFIDLFTLHTYLRTSALFLT